VSNITADLIKELREITGVGMSKCKEALVEANGDLQKAIDYLRKKGMASGAKKEGRETKEGLIGTGESDQALALVEANTETDFVAQNDKFKTFLADVANQAAETKPASLEAFMESPYCNDPSLTVEQYRNLLIQSLGENIQLKRIEIIEKDANASLGIYSHMGGKIITVVELSGANDAQDVAREIAMHVAAENPDYLFPEDVPKSVTDREAEIAKSQLKGKPENMIDKILVGKLRAFCDQVCLSCQKFIKDSSITVGQHVEQCAKDSGKELKLRRFWRWRVGQ